MKNNSTNQKLKAALIIAGALLVSFFVIYSPGGFFVSKNHEGNSKAEKTSDDIKREQAPVIVQEEVFDISAWSEYRNGEYGLSFNYPSDWKVEENRGYGFSVNLYSPGKLDYFRIQVAVTPVNSKHISISQWIGDNYMGDYEDGLAFRSERIGKENYIISDNDRFAATMSENSLISVTNGYNDNFVVEESFLNAFLETLTIRDFERPVVVDNYSCIKDAYKENQFLVQVFGSLLKKNHPEVSPYGTGSICKLKNENIFVTYAYTEEDVPDFRAGHMIVEYNSDLKELEFFKENLCPSVGDWTVPRVDSVTDKEIISYCLSGDAGYWGATVLSTDRNSLETIVLKREDPRYIKIFDRLNAEISE